MRYLVGLLSLLLGGAAMIACETRQGPPEPMAPASGSNAKQWVGRWILQWDDADPRENPTLTINEVNGNITASLLYEPDTLIEISDIAVGPRSLVLKYEGSTKANTPTKPASMLRIGSDRRVEIRDPSSRTIRRGVAGRLAVSREFLDRLVDEHDIELMIKKAQAAGLIVEKEAVSDGSFTRFIDPATGSIVATSSTVQ